MAATGSPQRAGSGILGYRQPSVFSGSSLFSSKPPPDNDVLTSNTSSTNCSQRHASVTPSASSFTFQSQPTSQSPTATLPVDRSESHPWAQFERLHRKRSGETSGRPPPTLVSAKQPSAQVDKPQYSRGSFAALATSQQPLYAQQLPSPSPSHASVVSEPVTSNRQDNPVSSSGFRKPCLPASAAPSSMVRPSVAPEARHVRAGTIESRASSVTLPADPRSPRGDLVASRTSNVPGRTGATHNRKRKIEVNLSSDEDEDPESDYAPSEPDSPLPNEPTRRAGCASVTKKSKVAHTQKTARRVERLLGKNVYGFKAKVIPKPKLDAATTSSSTASKSSTSNSAATSHEPVRASSVRPPPEVTHPKPKSSPALKKTLLKKKPIAHPSKRRAAVAAENKIQDIFDEAEKFGTEYAIEEADHVEDARLPEDMRRMSMTPTTACQPAPKDVESVNMLVASSPEPYHTPPPSASHTTDNISFMSPATPISPPGFDAWTQSRKTGDRHNFT
jgi:hypothetical protein